MSLLLDTNVVSELRKLGGPLCDENVARWASSTPMDAFFISVVTLFELEIGVGRIQRHDESQGRRLRHWLDAVVTKQFRQRILPITPEIATACANLNVPDKRPFADGFIAATASVHGMTLVTRNMSDFERTGVALFNPWVSQS